jgi:tripartite-type tricarboxylate transporter receptor subunit TctC
MQRRHLLQSALAAAALGSGGARAQEFPSRALRLLNGFAPGGAVDAVSRAVAERLAPMLGQPVLVENRPGAAGMLAAEAVARATPDGYTLGMLDMGALAVNPSLQPKLPYDVTRDYAYLGLVARIPLILVVHPSLPSTTRSLVEHLRANPGRISYASAGIGSPPHLAMETFKAASGSFAVHIPYRGAAAAVQDLIAGRVQMMFFDFNTASGHVKSGALRAVAVGQAERLAQWPEVPTFAESGLVAVTATPWIGLAVAAATPRAAVQRLSTALRDTLAQAETRGRIEQMGFTPQSGDGSALEQLVRQDGAVYAKLIRDQGIKLE